MPPMKSMKNKQIARLCFLIILAVIMASPSFSTQFLAWFAPFAAFLSFPEGLLILGVSTSTWIYSKYWDDVTKLMPLATSVLIFRNLLLVSLFIIVLTIFVKDLITKE